MLKCRLNTLVKEHKKENQASEKALAQGSSFLWTFHCKATLSIQDLSEWPCAPPWQSAWTELTGEVGTTFSFPEAALVFLGIVCYRFLFVAECWVVSVSSGVGRLCRVKVCKWSKCLWLCKSEMRNPHGPSCTQPVLVTQGLNWTKQIKLPHGEHLRDLKFSDQSRHLCITARRMVKNTVSENWGQFGYSAM